MNAELAFWLDLSGLGKKELARQVRARCHAKQLLHISTEASRVRGWLQGQRPEPAVAEAVAEVLTEACGEPLTPGRLGFSEGDRQLDQLLSLPWQLPPVVEAMDKHSRSDLVVTRHDPEVESHSVVTGRQLTEPLQRWLTAQASDLRMDQVAPRSVDTPHVAQIDQPPMSSAAGTTSMGEAYVAKP